VFGHLTLEEWTHTKSRIPQSNQQRGEPTAVAHVHYWNKIEVYH